MSMKINNYECKVFLKELNETLDAGLSSLESLEIILENIDNKKFKERLLISKEGLELGDSLSMALTKAQCFDNYMLKMIKIGEDTGYLDKVIFELSKYYERLDDSSNKIKEAIYYPSIILLMMIVVMGVIVIKVLPVFETVLSNMGSGLSFSALVLMKVGNYIAKYGFIIILVIISILIIYILYMYFKYHEDSLKYVLKSLPFTKKLAYRMEMSNLVFALSLLINSGYNEKDIIDMLKEIIDDKNIINKLDEIENMINEGHSLADSLCDVGIFKNIYTRMIKVGYRSGKFEKSINDVAIKYELEVSESINKFLNMIEPTIIILCSLIVGIILLSVMLPLLSVMSSI